ncbi:unnamed protein product [Nyctereutes procyonoides]|uniref:(raccoon dog) hypothetical protein n=1 Tax=Nyctereutes procyonoides TaxID=34880 RepID=A0A811ZFR5_NYCPR|nr:unnamed protein product [Nyctereutes procyonoides]
MIFPSEVNKSIWEMKIAEIKSTDGEKQTRPLGCLPSPRRPRPRLPGPSGCGTRVRDGRTLHCGPRAAHGRSGAGVLGPSAGSRRRRRSSRLRRRRRRRRRRRARPKHTHPPHPPPRTSAGRWARAPPSAPEPRAAALGALLATSRGEEALRQRRRAAAGSDTCGSGCQWAPSTSVRLCGAGSSRQSGCQRQDMRSTGLLVLPLMDRHCALHFCWKNL